MKSKFTFKNLSHASAKAVAIALLFTAKCAMAQVHVVGPEELKIGKDQAISAQPAKVEVVDILGSVYMTQEPTNGNFSGGSYFTTKWCPNGFPDPINGNMATYNPVMLPQWSNYFIGDGFNPMEQVYSNEFYATVGVWTLSDKSHKTNIKPIDSSLHKLLKVNTYRYDLIYKPKEGEPSDIFERIKKTGENQAGFMAQEIMNDYPHLVKKYNDKGTVGVNYTGFIPEIVRAMQEQQVIIDALKNEIETLKGSEVHIQKNNTDKLLQTNSLLTEINPIAPKQDITLQYKIQKEGEHQIRVYDLSGKQVYKTTILSSQNQEVIIPRKKLSPGTYQYTLLNNGEEMDTKKLIILD